MCLGVPGKVLTINDTVAKVDITGAIKEVNLMLVEDIRVGDYVIVHAGFAIQKVNEQEAQQTIKLLNDFIGET